MVRFHNEPPTHLTLPGLEAIGVRHAFTTRHHGSFAWVSAPGGPFAPGGGPALAAVGITSAEVRYVRQVHGTTCLVTDRRAPGLVGTADALVTTDPGCALSVFTADCVALVLSDPECPVLALAHVGWRGAVGGLPGRLVEVLAARFGARPERIHAALGPSIGPCCYEVDGPVLEPLRAAFPEGWDRWTAPRSPGRWRLDLWRASTDQLVWSGVRPDAVLNPRLCTACRLDLFFSYRREGSGFRLAALARLRSPGGSRRRPESGSSGVG